MFRIGNLLRDLFRGSSYRMSMSPREGTPPDRASDESPFSAGAPVDRTVEREPIPGTHLFFTRTAATYVGPQESLDRFRQEPGVMAGCHHLMRDSEDLGGSCPFCAEEAQEQAAGGLIDVPTAEARSLYCNRCGEGCDSCRSSTCRRHALPFEAYDGSTMLLCPTCLKDARRTRFLRGFLRVAASPFVRFRDDKDYSNWD